MRSRSERCPFVPIRARLESPGARYAGGAANAASATVRRHAASAWRVRARSQHQIEVERRRDSRRDLEPDALGQAVLDHGPCPLTHAAGVTETCLRFESHQASVTQVEAKVKDHVLDWHQLIAQGIWHRGIPAGGHQPSLIDHFTERSSERRAGANDRQPQQRESPEGNRRGGCLPAGACFQRGREGRPVGVRPVTRYNRSLTCRGTAQTCPPARRTTCLNRIPRVARW